jgi:hypothetical protein
VSLAKPTPDEIAAILIEHGKWLSGDGGARATLTGADLTGADLTGADLSWANLSWANLSGANLTRANLSRANLSWANLTRANLSRANLSRATLTGADLTGATLTRTDLTGAYLTGAVGIVRERHIDLLMLLDQPGPIRAYKLVTADGSSPIYSEKLSYPIGAVISVDNANTDPNEPCGIGIHVATLPWVLREWGEGNRVFLVEFTAADIACIPTATDGKFRLHRCTVVSEKDVSAFVGVK